MFLRRLPQRWRIRGILLTFILVFVLYYNITRGRWSNIDYLFILGAILAAYWIGGVLALPLEKTLTSLINFQDSLPEERISAFAETDWNTLSRKINALIERCELSERRVEEKIKQRTLLLQRKADQLQAVSEVGRQVAAVLDTPKLLRFVTALLRGTFHYDLVAVYLIDGKNLVLASCASRWSSPDEYSQVTEDINDEDTTLLKKSVADGIPRINNGETPVTRLVPERKICSEVVVPVNKGSKIMGALIAQSCLENAFDDEDLKTLETLTHQIAIALENARLFEAEKKLRELAVFEERNRIAQEIHDTLAQSFMGILLLLRAVDPLLKNNPLPIEQHIKQALELAETGLQEARRSVWNLRPKPLDGKTLLEALEEAVEITRRQTKIDLDYRCQGTPYNLPSTVETAILRIGQEALYNIIKHAKAAKAQLELVYTPDALKLVVSDNGIGINVDDLSKTRLDGGGFGMTSMTERARQIGGSLTIKTELGKGSVLTLEYQTNLNKDKAIN